jgi:hypothetical protein
LCAQRPAESDEWEGTTLIIITKLMLGLAELGFSVELKPVAAVARAISFFRDQSIF